jgi:hypothetical protein
VSCKTKSKPLLDKITPVTPPTVNNTKNPKINNIGTENSITPPTIVANQLNIFTPVGIAIIIVVAVKYALVSTSIPTVYI